MLHVEIPIGGGSGREYTTVNTRDLWVTEYTLTYNQGYVRADLTPHLDLLPHESEVAILSRFIMGTPPHLVCHHVNGEGTDNTRENLLECTHSEHKTMHSHTKHNMQ
jgi:hypothetical protein